MSLGGFGLQVDFSDFSLTSGPDLRSPVLGARSPAELGVIIASIGVAITILLSAFRVS